MLAPRQREEELYGACRRADQGELGQVVYPFYAWIGLTDADGAVVASTGGLLEGIDVAQRPWFQGGRQASFVDDVHEAKLLAELLPQPDGEPLRFVDAAAPVVDENGQLRGVLGAHLSWAWAADAQTQILASVEPARQIEVIVARADGQMLLGPPTLYEQALPAAALPPAAGRSRAQVLDWPDGRAYLTTGYRSAGYATYPGLGWIVLVRQPAAVGLAPADRLAWQLVLSTLGVMAFLTLLTGITVSRATRPLRRIAVAADRLRIGDPPRRAGADVSIARPPPRAAVR